MIYYQTTQQHHFMWIPLPEVQAETYVCGFCSKHVSSDKGWKLSIDRQDVLGTITLCPNCSSPTFYSVQQNRRYPGSPFGNSVPSLPPDISVLYDEARRCTSAGCYTAAVLLLRKLLMNISVDQGADEGKSFVYYINFLESEHFAPPNSKGWLEQIRQKGNEATHKVTPKNADEAQELVLLVEMLLRFNYQFPPKSLESN